VLCRSNMLTHPSGQPLRTPLLVPSFSSKGFGFSKSGKSEAGQLLRVASEYLTDSMLLSAYDLYHKHLVRPKSILTAITFVDSGGYETSEFRDLSTVFAHTSSPKDWNQEMLQEVYADWPDHIPAVFLGFDRIGPIRKQIESAHRLLRRYPNQMHALLLKPRSKSSTRLPIAEITASSSELGLFHAVGVTEKELGASPLERMEAISRIRLGLDDVGLQRVPIHVFGSLDPITVPLYFLAGAEIFDGLTWLRFGYDEGVAAYTQNCAARRYGIHHTDDQSKLLTLQHNLVVISDLGIQMRMFLNEHAFEHFGRNADLFRRAYESLRSSQPRAS
jgi:hypothetical protein